MSQNAEEQIHYLSSNDVLTGLSNHTLFKNITGTAMAFAACSDSKVILQTLDLYNVKILSDSFVHSAGDFLLRIVTSQLKIRARYQAAMPLRWRRISHCAYQPCPIRIRSAPWSARFSNSSPSRSNLTGVLYYCPVSSVSASIRTMATEAFASFAVRYGQQHLPPSTEVITLVLAILQSCNHLNH